VSVRRQSDVGPISPLLVLRAMPSARNKGSILLGLGVLDPVTGGVVIGSSARRRTGLRLIGGVIVGPRNCGRI
jgi:hypothetical protein